MGRWVVFKCPSNIRVKEMTLNYKQTSVATERKTSQSPGKF